MFILDCTMTITLYGIPNCDTVKKARLWLATHGLGFTFHDVKKQPLERATMLQWLEQLPSALLVNRKGTTWRALPDERKAAIIADDGAEAAIALMLELPSVIKRPVLAHAGRFHVGFSDQQYQQIFTIQDEPSP
jgi:arsenate reductase